MGGSKSKSKQQPTQSAVNPVQNRYLSRLYATGNSDLRGSRRIAGQLSNQVNANMTQALQQNRAGIPGAQEAINRNLNPMTDPRYDIMAAQINRNLSENLLPSIQSNAISVNNLGGSRQGVAEAQGIDAAQRAMVEGFGNLYGENQNRALAAAGMQQGNLMDLVNISPTAATLRQQPAIAQSAILGNPTVLTSGGGSKSSGKSKSLL